MEVKSKQEEFLKILNVIKDKKPNTLGAQCQNRHTATFQNKKKMSLRNNKCI